MILSFFTNSKNQLYIFLIAILLISSATANISSVTNLDSQPNARVNELIDYMESNNITYAYAYYWDAGITTYLANEKVLVRPVIFTDSGFIPYEWNSCVRWYNERPTEYFVIRDNDAQSNTPDAFVTAHKPDRVLYCGNYTLYHYSGLNATSVYDTWLTADSRASLSISSPISLKLLSVRVPSFRYCRKRIIHWMHSSSRSGSLSKPFQ